MPDQTTPNPTGGTPQPQSSAANSIQAAQESAWLKLRDQAKTATDVSNMMVDLSADDFNALSAQITEAKRYGRKEVSYKGFKLPVPDKPTSALKKLFEEKQTLGQAQIELASAGLGQQVFGTGASGVASELGKMLGIKPKKKKAEGKKPEEGGRRKKEVGVQKEETTDKAEVLTSPAAEKPSTGDDEETDLGSLTTDEKESAAKQKLNEYSDRLFESFKNNSYIGSIDADGNRIQESISELKKLPLGVEITTKDQDGKTKKTVLSLSSVGEINKTLNFYVEQADHRASIEAEKSAKDLIGSDFLYKDGNDVRMGKIKNTRYLKKAPMFPESDEVEVELTKHDGKSEKLTYERGGFRQEIAQNQEILKRELAEQKSAAEKATSENQVTPPSESITSAKAPAVSGAANAVVPIISTGTVGGLMTKSPANAAPTAPAATQSSTPKQLSQEDAKRRAEMQASAILGKEFYTTDQQGRVYHTRVNEAELQSDGRYLMRLINDDGKLEIQRLTPAELDKEIMTGQRESKNRYQTQTGKRRLAQEREDKFKQLEGQMRGVIGATSGESVDARSARMAKLKEFQTQLKELGQSLPKNSALKTDIGDFQGRVAAALEDNTRLQSQAEIDNSPEIKAMVEMKSKADAEFSKTNKYLQTLLDKQEITPQDALEFARAENALYKNTSEWLKTYGDDSDFDEFNKVFQPLRRKLDQFPEAKAAYEAEDHKLRTPLAETAAAVIGKAALGMSTGTGVSAGVGAAAMAAGIAGAALGATLESTRRVTATAGAAGQAATEAAAVPSSVQVTKERKATISSTTQAGQAAPQEAAAGVESVNVEKERKAKIESAAQAAPPPPSTTVPSGVNVERERKASVTGPEPTAATAGPTARQQSRAAFRMPGGAPPSGTPPSGTPPTGGGGPPGPRATPTLSTQQLLNQADAFVEETKKLTARMMANPSNVMLKAEMRGLRDRATNLRGRIGNTQKSISMFAPEHAALESLDDRVGMIEESLMGGSGIGSSLELTAGLGLYDSQRNNLGKVLAPGAGTTPSSARAAGPKPTGAAGPSVITGQTMAGGAAFPGPQAPRPIVGTAAQRGAASQMSAAMQLGAAQQQAAMQQMTGEEMAGSADQSGMTESSISPDVRSQIMGEQGGPATSTVLPGQYAPPGYGGEGRSPQHFARTERMPGSATGAEEEPTEAEQAEGGGEIGSDEAERARVLARGQEGARRAADFSGAARVAAGKVAARPGAPGGSSVSKPPATSPMPAAGGKGGGGAAGGIMALQQAMALSAQKEQSRFRQVQAVREQIEGAQRAVKNLQNIWRIVNASELASSEAAFPIIMWVVTSNLQLINKYSFKVRFIPPASLVEDAFTMCADCVLGSSCLVQLIFYIIIATLLVLPYVVAAGVVGGAIANLVGVEAMLKALEILAKMKGL